MSSAAYELWWDHSVLTSFDWKRVVWDIPRPRTSAAGLLTELLGLREILHSLARDLSLGQRNARRLAMALLHEPEMLFWTSPRWPGRAGPSAISCASSPTLNRERRVTVMVTATTWRTWEQLAGRVVMIHRGSIAFDGAFSQLRRHGADRRRLFLETRPGPAPSLDGAQLAGSADGRHEYVFDATLVNISTLLEQAAAQTRCSTWRPTVPPSTR